MHDYGSPFAQDANPREMLLASLRQARSLLEAEQRQRDAEIVARRWRHQRKAAWLHEQETDGKPPSLREWHRMMDETQPLPPSPVELVAHLEAALAMLRGEFSGYSQWTAYPSPDVR